MFWLKKAIAFWLMPLPLCLGLLVFGLWLTRVARRSPIGRIVLAAAALWLALCSNKAVSIALIRPLERAYPPVPEFVAGQPPPAGLAACRYVLVLGGGSGSGHAPGVAAINRLSAASRARLLEGLRVWRAQPGAKLVVSGASSPGRPTHAAVVAQAAISLGVDPARIVRLDAPRDTEDEAAAMRGLAGDEPFALVTSAWHMRRAMALFQHTGARPFPCPTDYLAPPPDDFQWSDYGWDLDSLGRSTWAIYERFGYFWEWLRGKV